jgi:alkylhydroperoxidase/carboxymuconolactone decarboxylase family protein YurZ
MLAFGIVLNVRPNSTAARSGLNSSMPRRAPFCQIGVPDYQTGGRSTSHNGSLQRAESTAMTNKLHEENFMSESNSTPVSDHMRAVGNWNPGWDVLAELDAAYTEKFLSMGAHAMSKGTLDPLTIDASCTHMYAPGVRRHIRKALELGATRDQIMTVLELVSVLGIHSVALGAPLLIEEAQKLARDGPIKGTF